MIKQHIYAVARTIYSNSGAPQVGIAFDKDGNVLTANGGLIQVVPARNGTFYGQPMTVGNVYTIAPLDGEGGGVAVDSHGNVLMADAFGNVVLVLAASSGTFYGQQMTAGHVYTIAGTGQPGDTGDGGPATAAQLYGPLSVAADRHDNVLIADGGDGVRVVAGASGTFFGRRMIAGDIYTIARRLNHYATQLAVDARGNVVSAAGNVRVIAAGTGTFYGVRMRVGHVYVIAGYGRRTVYPGERIRPPGQLSATPPASRSAAPALCSSPTS